MKKICLIMVLAILFVANMTASTGMVSSDNLPQDANDFIVKNFANDTIENVEQNADGFEVTLSDGSVINFKTNGEWESVQNDSGIPTNILPSVAESSLSENFTEVKVVKLKKDDNIFEVNLSNQVKIFFDENGEVVSTEDEVILSKEESIPADDGVAPFEGMYL